MVGIAKAADCPGKSRFLNSRWRSIMTPRNGYAIYLRKLRNCRWTTGNTMRKTAVTAALIGAVLPFGALSQTSDDLKKHYETPGDVLVYGMGYSGQRYSPLTQIDRNNVRRLVPKWAYSMNDLRGAEAMPIVRDGVIYTTAHNATVALVSCLRNF